MQPNPIPIVLIGANTRSTTYGYYALRKPDEMRAVALAEASAFSSEVLGKAHNIPGHRRFENWADLLDMPPLGDVAVVCLPAIESAAPVLNLLDAGYHVLMDTPMALSPAGCRRLVEAAEASPQMLMVTHALRYSSFYRSLYDIIRSGRLGQIISYQHDRSLPYWYIAHRFLRGSERGETENALLFQEGLQELDLMLWLLDTEIEAVSSTASSRSFDLSSAPAEVPSRCVDNCPIETECPFSAIGIYLERRFRGLPQKGWPYTDLAEDSPTALVAAVEVEQCGACVYHSGIRLVDHQTILMTSTSGANFSLTLNGHSLEEARTIQINGSQGVLTATLTPSEAYISFYDHASHKENTINFHLSMRGTEYGLMANLVKIVRGETEPLNLARHALEAHLVAFAAEEARHFTSVVNMQEFRAR